MQGQLSSSIRQQLRTWSEEQAKNGLESASSNNIRPSSLFLEQTSDYDESLEEDYDDELTTSNRFKLEPGDAVELIASGVVQGTQLCIHIRTVAGQDQFLVEDGRWAATSIVRTKSPPLRGFVDPILLEPLMPFLPQSALTQPSDTSGMTGAVDGTGDVPSEIAAPFLTMIRGLKEEGLAFRREHILRMERTHELLADEDEFRVETIDQCTNKLFGKPLSELSPGASHAFFKEIEKDPMGCQICKRPDQTFKLVLTPKVLVRKFEKVREWARQYQDAAAQAALGNNVVSSLAGNPLNTFIEKARRIILKSRKIRSPTTIGNLGPSTAHKHVQGTITRADAGETYTETDNMIIEFIWNTFLRTPRVLFNGAAQSVASLILRAIGAYPSLRLEQKIGRLLLQELGVKAPWAERADEDVVLPVPGRRGGRAAAELFEESEKLVLETGMDLPPYEVKLLDTMAHLRHDWGEAQVFCLDKASADILDDGFSIEKCNEIPGAHWLHVHTAHPSAFIDPNHIFAKRARGFSASLYTSRQSYPMLPHYFAMATCLGTNRPCLTLSTLILSSGEIQEVKMVPGTIKNVIRLNPRAVDQVLGRHDPQVANLVVGGRHAKPPDLSPRELQRTERYRDLLQTASEVCQARLGRRVKEVPEVLDIPYHDINFDVWVTFTTETEYDGRQNEQSQHYLGDPVIHISSSRFERTDRNVRRYKVDSLTAQLMSIASEGAAKWCRDREIPAIFQTSSGAPGFSPAKVSNLKGSDLVVMPRQELSSTPKPHVFLNCNEYMRFTSPLRRYTDLIGHWQIDAYLRAEGKSQDRKVGYGSTEELIMTKASLDEYIHNESQTIKDLDKLMRRSKVHWTYQAMFRAFHFKEATLPEVWDIYIEKQSGKKLADDVGLRGRLIPFHLSNLRVLKSDEGYERHAKVGQYLPVKIELVDIEVPTMHVKAVGPPSDAPLTRDPVDIRANINEKEILPPPNDGRDYSLHISTDQPAGRKDAVGSIFGGGRNVGGRRNVDDGEKFLREAEMKERERRAYDMRPAKLEKTGP